MKRGALIGGVSIAALLCVWSAPISAKTIDVESWWGRDRAATADQSRKSKKRGSISESKSGKAAEKAAPAPTGPLQIIVSIDKQRATLFSDGIAVASTPVSTGTPGHPTPMGVFTVIQKDRHHVSNLYDASMPYMQRITWSGSALHQGPLPGYPASHGCVRLTESFAQLLWRTTKLGARVIVTKPDVSPVSFESPRLAWLNPKPEETASAPKPHASEPAIMSTVIKTADAGNSVPLPMMQQSDAKPTDTKPLESTVAGNAQSEQSTKLSTTTTGESVQSEPVKSAETEAKPAEAAAPQAAEAPKQADADTPKQADAESKPSEELASQTAEAPKPTELETKPAEQAAEPTAEPQKAAETEAKPNEQPAPQVAETPKATEPAAPVAEAVTPTATPEPAPAAKAAEAPKPVELAAPPSIVVEEKPVVPDTPVAEEKPDPVATALAKVVKNKPISVFVSLKEGKLYVRQGWVALFDVPVTIEHPEQPIGTHVYTAMGLKPDGDLRWTVISIPSGYRHAAEPKRVAEHGRKSRNERTASVEEKPATPSPAAALERIVVPPDVADRIASIMTTGSSLIVSDNRLSDETDASTDFIVTTR
jgi:L,D-transpeptidase-like protein